ncbi:hypothetical protein AB685_05650 [Bacillus sp. LL01]|nr:hypothetical protein AB685_05650 [Bacillus sp. LL01]
MNFKNNRKTILSLAVGWSGRYETPAGGSGRLETPQACRGGSSTAPRKANTCSVNQQRSCKRYLTIQKPHPQPRDGLFHYIKNLAIFLYFMDIGKRKYKDDVELYTC